MWARMMPDPSPQQKAARLLERLAPDAGSADGREALESLKELAGSECIRVSGGEHGAIATVLALLGQGDTQLSRDALDVLVNLLDPKVPSSDRDAAREKSAHNVDAFLEIAAPVSQVLGVLEEEDMYVRYNATQLMLCVLGADRGRVQGYLLADPMGVAAATELLSDRREVVRNDALLLLAELTRESSEIQRIVAFQGAFERLLDIIAEESDAGGSVIVDDALSLLSTLLRANSSNQRLFVETGCVERLEPLLALAAGGRLASAQTVSSQVCACDVVRALVDEPPSSVAMRAKGGSSAADSLDAAMAQADMATVQDCRTRVGACGMLARLVHLATSPSTSTEPVLRQSAMLALASAIAEHEANQRLLLEMRVLVSADRTESAPLRFLALALRGATRAAVEPPLAVLRGLLGRSPHAQLTLAATLAPMPTGVSADGGGAPQLEPSFARTLARALLSTGGGDGGGPTPPSASQAQLAAEVLCALVRDNDDAKQLLMRTPVDASLEDAGAAANGRTTSSADGLLARMCGALLSLGTAVDAADSEHADTQRLTAQRHALLRACSELVRDCPAAASALCADAAVVSMLVSACSQPAAAGAEAEAHAHTQGQAALVLGHCLLAVSSTAQDDAAVVAARAALVEALVAHTGAQDALRAALDRVRASRQFVGARDAAYALARGLLRPGEAAEGDGAVVPPLGPLPLYAPSSVRQYEETCADVQQAMLTLYAEPPAPLDAPIPFTSGAAELPAQRSPAAASSPKAGGALSPKAAAMADAVFEAHQPAASAQPVLVEPPPVFVPPRASEDDEDEDEDEECSDEDERAGPAGAGLGGLACSTLAAHSEASSAATLDSYKQLIREQDNELRAAQVDVSALRVTVDTANARYLEAAGSAKRASVGVAALRAALADADAEASAMAERASALAAAAASSADAHTLDAAAEEVAAAASAAAAADAAAKSLGAEAAQLRTELESARGRIARLEADAAAAALAAPPAAGAVANGSAGCGAHEELQPASVLFADTPATPSLPLGAHADLGAAVERAAAEARASAQAELREQHAAELAEAERAAVEARAVAVERAAAEARAAAQAELREQGAAEVAAAERAAAEARDAAVASAAQAAAAEARAAVEAELNERHAAELAAAERAAAEARDAAIASAVERASAEARAAAEAELGAAHSAQLAAAERSRLEASDTALSAAAERAAAEARAAAEVELGAQHAAALSEAERAASQARDEAVAAAAQRAEAETRAAVHAELSERHAAELAAAERAAAEAGDAARTEQQQLSAQLTQLRAERDALAASNAGGASAADERVRALEEQMRLHEEHAATQHAEITRLAEAEERARTELERAVAEAERARVQCDVAETALRGKSDALRELEEEHEELLCCLAEQDMQCTALQERLTAHGVPLPFPLTPGGSAGTPLLQASHDVSQSSPMPSAGCVSVSTPSSAAMVPGLR